MSKPTFEMESRILDLALRRGLLSEAQIREVTARSHGPKSLDEAWPPRLARLLAEGLLSTELLEALAWEARHSGDEVSPSPETWVDPALAGNGPAQLPEDLVWDRYESLSFLGMGASARVYKAYDPKLERWVALKFLLGGRPGQEEAMLREARAQAQVEHPNVCKIYEVGQVADLHYIAMQLVEGRPLSAVMGGLSQAQKVELVRDVAEGIHAAHRRGLVHLDLKPGNILLEALESGGYHPFVTDFGLMAQELVAGQGSLGTPPYSSPEQIRGEVAGLDRRSDVYSLGVVLYVMLSGALPYEVDTAKELLARILEGTPVPLRHRVADLAEDLGTIVEVCMRKQRNRRYPSALALAEDLQRFLDGEPLQARPSTPLYRLRKWVGRNRAMAAVSGASAVLVLGLGAFGLRTSLRARAQARLAQRFGQEAERMEALVRYAHLQPAHDIRPELQEVQARMGSLRSEVAEAGSIAEGPGFHALGRACMALGRFGEAREFLEAAWKAGERGTSIEFDLGRVLGDLYDEGLGDLRSFPGEERRKRRKVLEKTLRDPALAHLRKGRAESPAEAAYQEAMVAFYEERLEDARAKAREAQRQAPWFYEAQVLEAEVWLAMGRGRIRLSAQRDEAFADMARAESPLALALARGASDPRNYLQAADRWYEIAFLDSLYRPEDEEAAIQRGLEVLDRALQVQPDLAQIHLLRSEFLWNLGRQRGLKGGEAEQPFQEAREAVDRAIQLEPENARNHQIRADVLGATAEWRVARGLGALEPLQQGLASLERAVALGRRDHYTYRSMGYLLSIESNEIYSLGRDPREVYRKAIDAYEHAIALDPKDQMSLNNASVLYAQRVELDLEEGKYDPALTQQGLALVRQGLDLSPDSEPFWSNRNYLLRLEARAARKQGRPAGHLLDQAEAAGRRACELAPGSATARIEAGDTELERARWELAQGRTPEPALARARSSFDQAKALNPQDSDAPRGLAESCWIEVQWRVPQRLRVRVQVDQGIASAEASLKLNPRQDQSRAIRGALRALVAEQFGKQGRSEAMAGERDLAQALSSNPFLVPAFKESLEGARRLLR